MKTPITPQVINQGLIEKIAASMRLDIAGMNIEELQAGVIAELDNMEVRTTESLDHKKLVGAFNRTYDNVLQSPVFYSSPDAEIGHPLQGAQGTQFDTTGLVEQLIKEELNKMLDEPAGGPLGKVAFSPKRMDSAYRKEPNTKVEESMFIAIHAHIYKNEPGLLKNMFPKIYALAKAGKYPEILSPPEGIVYRILGGVSLKTASKILNLPISELKTDKVWYVDTKHVLQPRKFIQSWTSKPNASVLEDLALDNGEGGPITILLEAEVPASGKFILNPSAACKIAGINEFCDESETISGGPVKLIGASFHYSDPDNYREPSYLSGTKLVKSLLAALDYKAKK